MIGAAKGRTSLLSSPMCEAAASLGGAYWPSSPPITGARCAPSKAAVATTENPAADANVLCRRVRHLHHGRQDPFLPWMFDSCGEDSSLDWMGTSIGGLRPYWQSAIEAQGKEE